jgi:hypothetical protein
MLAVDGGGHCWLLENFYQYSRRRYSSAAFVREATVQTQ